MRRKQKPGHTCGAWRQLAATAQTTSCNSSRCNRGCNSSRTAVESRASFAHMCRRTIVSAVAPSAGTGCGGACSSRPRTNVQAHPVCPRSSRPLSRARAAGAYWRSLCCRPVSASAAQPPVLRPHSPPRRAVLAPFRPRVPSSSHVSDRRCFARARLRCCN